MKRDLIKKDIHISNTVVTFTLTTNTKAQGCSGYFAMPHPEQPKKLGMVRITLNPVELLSTGGCTDVLAVILHEFQEYYMAAKDLIWKPAFGDDKYSFTRRRILLEHDTTFCDMCDEAAYALGQIWTDLSGIWMKEPPKEKQRGRAKASKKKTNKS